MQFCHSETSIATIATCADVTALLVSNKYPNKAPQIIQNHLSIISNWPNNCNIKMKKLKSVQINFTLTRIECSQLSFNNEPIPIENVTKNIGVRRDKRLTWAQFVKTKNKGKLTLTSPLSNNISVNEFKKQIFYKTIIDPL